MTQEEYEKGFVDYMTKNNGKDYEKWYNKEHIEDMKADFLSGAQWRINSVWHKPYDIAEAGKECLVEFMDGDGNTCIRIDWRSEYEWVNACHYEKILRWAYIKDLIPNK